MFSARSGAIKENMMFKLGKRSLSRLDGVHPELVAVVKKAIELTEIDFTVLEGVRTVERQRKLYDAGASRTMNSRHLSGHAVDLGALIDGKIAWDWPLYDKIALAMIEASGELDVVITWGGHWTSFKDGPHFELQRNKYP